MTRTHAAYFGASALVVVGAALAVFLTHRANLIVSGRDWRREIQVQDYQPRQLSGWDETVPGDAYNQQCYRRQRGSHRIASGESCTTDSRGHQSCTTNYVTIPDFDTWCDYTADRWDYKRSLVTEGEGQGAANIPAWPTVDVTPCEGYGCEREADHLQRYRTYFQDRDSGETYTCEFVQDTWAGFRIETFWTMDVGSVFHIPRCETVAAQP